MHKIAYKSGDITFEKICTLFHLPINEAAKSLNICPTLLKNLCREMGISRWPHRQLKSLKNMINQLELIRDKNEEIQSKINTFKQKYNYIQNNPKTFCEPLHDERKQFRLLKSKYSISDTSSKQKQPYFTLSKTKSPITKPKYTKFVSVNIPSRIINTSNSQISVPPMKYSLNNFHNYDTSYDKLPILEPKIIMKINPYVPFKI